MADARELRVGDEFAGERLDRFLARALGLSRGYVRRLLGLGRVHLAGAPVVKGGLLRAGDVIRIGTLALKFDQTPKAIRPGGNVRFASQLKDFGSECAEGGRTMLGIAIEDDVASTLPPQPVARARGISADGNLEEISELEPLAADFDDFPAAPQPPRNLDLELAPDLLGTDDDAGETIARLEFEVKGPGRSLKAVLAALQGKRIEIPPFTIRLRGPRGG